jgi:hypothetical protein
MKLCVFFPEKRYLLHVQDNNILNIPDDSQVSRNSQQPTNKTTNETTDATRTRKFIPQHAMQTFSTSHRPLTGQRPGRVQEGLPRPHERVLLVAVRLRSSPGLGPFDDASFRRPAAAAFVLVVLGHEVLNSLDHFPFLFRECWWLFRRLCVARGSSYVDELNLVV